MLLLLAVQKCCTVRFCFKCCFKNNYYFISSFLTWSFSSCLSLSAVCVFARTWNRAHLQNPTKRHKLYLLSYDFWIRFKHVQYIYYLSGTILRAHFWSVRTSFRCYAFHKIKIICMFSISVRGQKSTRRWGRKKTHRTNKINIKQRKKGQRSVQDFRHDLPTNICFLDTFKKCTHKSSVYA